MSRRLSHLLTLLAALMLIGGAGGCDKDKGGEGGGGGATSGASAAGGDDGERASTDGGASGGDDGAMSGGSGGSAAAQAPAGPALELMALPFDAGQPLSSTTAASGTARSPRPGSSWAYQSGAGNGSFLLAGSSAPNTAGGDVLRQINLDAEPPVEVDHNPALPGTQGVALIVPRQLRGTGPGGWPGDEFSGDLFTGTICGLIPGPQNKVIALAGHGALVIDTRSLNNVSGGAIEVDGLIRFPRGSQVCRGVYSQTHERLYTTATPRIEATVGMKGVYVTQVPTGKTALYAPYFTLPVGYGANGHSRKVFQSIELYNNRLYLLEGGARYNNEDDTALHVVPLNAEGEPLFEQAKIERAHNPVHIMPACPLSGSNLPAMRAIELGGQPILLTGGTGGVAMWDISEETPKLLDGDSARPGQNHLDLMPHGLGIVGFDYIINAQAVLGLPHCHSQTAIDDPTLGRFHRHDLVAFSLSGREASGAPKAFPVGDLNFLALRQKIQQAVGAQGRVPDFSKMQLRDMAVGPRHAVFVGAGGRGNTGLGNASDVIIFDLQKKAPVAYALDQANQSNAHTLRYGLDLGQGEEGHTQREQSVHAAIWLP